MVTTQYARTLATVLFGKTRRAVLSLLFGHTDESFYLRQIGRRTNAGMGALQREVKLLSDAGIIRRSVQGKQVYYQANPDCPIFEELKGLVVKTFGVTDVLRTGLSELSDRVIVAFLFGSLIRGGESVGSDVDIMVVGNVTFAEVVSAVGPLQETLNREINPTVYPEAEFREKLVTGHHFLTSVLDEEKIFLIGDASELERLAG